MMTPSRKRSLQQPAVAAWLVVAAVLAWILSLRLHSSPAAQHVDAGVDYARRHMPEQAEQEWQTAGKLDPSDPRPWTYLGELYLDVHRWQAAYDAYMKLLLIQPNAPHLDAHLAQACLGRGDEQTAYHYAEAALKDDPNDADAIRLFCGLLSQTGQDQMRLDLLRHLVKLEPNREDDQILLVEGLVSKRLFEEAKPIVEKLLAQDPNSPRLHALHGMILFSADSSAASARLAASDFQQAVQDPRYATFAGFYLGRIYSRLDQPAKALPYLEAAAQAMPLKREVLFALAEGYRETRQADRAAHVQAQFDALRRDEERIDQLTTVCREHPNDFAAQKEIGERLLHHQEYRKAVAHLSQALTLHSDDTGIQSALAEAQKDLDTQSATPSPGSAGGLP